MDELDLGATIRGFVAGQKVFNRYTLIKQLGRGGMGVVWRARDESLEQDVAIKMLPEIVANDPASVRDLKRETSRNQQLSHPHILRVFDFVESGALCGITMEVAEGGTLAHRRLDQPNELFEVADIRDWVRQLCEALDYAHRRAKVVHRDLKPANLMLTKDGELKVTDFGIAASLSESVTRVSKQGSSSGTPLYMSPQQMMGEKPAVTDDLYALGATLYELVTGKPPFYAGNVILQVQNKVAPSLAQRRQDLEIDGAPIPAEWEETIAACLAKEPKDRPQSAREVAERLGLAEGAARRTTQVASAPARQPALRPAPPGGAPSKARIAGLVVAGAVATLVAAYLILVVVPEWKDRQAERARQRVAEEVTALSAEREYREMKAALGRFAPTVSLEEMQRLSDEISPYFNHGGATTARHHEVRDEWNRRYVAWSEEQERAREAALQEERDRSFQKAIAAENAAAAAKQQPAEIGGAKSVAARVAEGPGLPREFEAAGTEPLVDGQGVFSHLESPRPPPLALSGEAMSFLATEITAPNSASHTAPGGRGELLPGVEVAELTEELRTQYRIPAEASGLVVTAASDARAAESLAPGAVILSINREAVRALAGARSLLKPGRNMLLVHVRGAQRFLVVSADPPVAAVEEIRVEVRGAVNRAGALKLSAGTDLAGALEKAGGLSPVGNARAVRITRRGPDAPLTFIVNLQDGTKTPALEDGDIIFVPERLI